MCLWLQHGDPRIPIVPPLLINPWPEENIFLTNEWIGTVKGWSEGSLVTAENVLHHYFGLSKPKWITRKNYNKILFEEDSLTNVAALDEIALPGIDFAKANQG